MNGREVFRHAVSEMAGLGRDVLARAGYRPADLDLLVLHQANRRIIDVVARKLDLPPEKVVMTVDRHANTSAASIPLALDAAAAEGRIRPGQLVCSTRSAAGSLGGGAGAVVNAPNAVY